MTLNTRSGFTTVEALITLVLTIIIITLAVRKVTRENRKEAANNKQQCAAMFSLANNLRDSVKVVKIREGCLQYVQVL